MKSAPNLKREVSLVLRTLARANKAVLKMSTRRYEINKKRDGSFVTDIDCALDRLIFDSLERGSCYGIISEENTRRPKRKSDYAWVVDPLDGTAEFIKGKADYGVSIGLIFKGESILGGIVLPAKKETYFASKHNGAFLCKNGRKRRIKISSPSRGGNARITIAGAFPDLKRRLLRLGHVKITTAGSAVVKSMLVAIGQQDLYIHPINRRHSIHGWDICAADIIVSEAGGIVSDLNGKKLAYGHRTKFRNGLVVSNAKIPDGLKRSLKKVASLR